MQSSPETGLPIAGMPTPNQEFNASEITSREIDLAVRNLLEADDVTACATLEKSGSELDAGAKLPLSKEL